MTQKGNTDKFERKMELLEGVRISLTTCNLHINRQDFRQLIINELDILGGHVGKKEVSINCVETVVKICSLFLSAINGLKIEHSTDINRITEKLVDGQDNTTRALESLDNMIRADKLEIISNHNKIIEEQQNRLESLHRHLTDIAETINFSNNNKIQIMEKNISILIKEWNDWLEQSKGTVTVLDNPQGADLCDIFKESVRDLNDISSALDNETLGRIDNKLDCLSENLLGGASFLRSGFDGARTEIQETKDKLDEYILGLQLNGQILERQLDDFRKLVQNELQELKNNQIQAKGMENIEKGVEDLRNIQQKILERDDTRFQKLEQLHTSVQKELEDLTALSSPTALTPVEGQLEVTKFTENLIQKVDTIGNVLDIVNDMKQDILFIKNKTYAEVVGNRRERNVLQERIMKEKESGYRVKPRLILQPRDEAEVEQESMEIIKRHINPISANIKINKIQKLQTGKTMIITDTENDIEKIIKEIDKNPQLRHNIKYNKIRKRNPRIIVYDIEESYDIRSLTESIIKQNDLFTIDNFRVEFKISSKNGNHWILCLVPSLYKVLNNNREIFLGWRSLSFRDFISPRFCSTCHRLGHFAHVCEYRNDCKKCYINHGEGDCPGDFAGCINC